MVNTIELSREEQAVLDEILTRELETTRAELHHTDDHTYRRIVKRHLELTRELLSKVQELPGGEYQSSERVGDEQAERTPRGEA